MEDGWFPKGNLGCYCWKKKVDIVQEKKKEWPTMPTFLKGAVGETGAPTATPTAPQNQEQRISA